MKSLFARAKASREEVAPPALPPSNGGFEVPRCHNCGAPREAAAGQELSGVLAAVCRYCKHPARG